MLKNKSITKKILILLLLTTLGTLLVAGIMSYIQFSKTAQYLESQNESLGNSAADKAEDSLRGYTEDAILALVRLRSQYIDQYFIEKRIKVSELSEYLNNMDSVYNMSEKELLSDAKYAFMPILKTDTSLNTGYLVMESGQSYVCSATEETIGDYDLKSCEWYRSAMEKPGQAVWIDTYDSENKVVYITCAKTVNDPEGIPQGVVALETTLTEIASKNMDITVGETGKAFIIDENMEFIVHSAYKYQENTTLDDVLSLEDAPALERIMGNDLGLELVTIDGVRSYFGFGALKESGWRICLTMDEREIVAPARQVKADIILSTQIAQEAINESNSRLIWKYLVGFLFLSVIVVLIARSAAQSVTKPLDELVENARKIGEGDFSIRTPVTSNDEIGELSKTFNMMAESLSYYVEDVKKTTAEIEKARTELEVANTIQKSLLPSVFPAFPDRDEFDIFAINKPAKAVGGDFYDFFFIDDEHLAIVIADVSGKGITGALFMMMSQTLIRTTAKTNYSPSDILEKVNKELCKNNKAEMFVTVWLGIVDLTTGVINAVNAGHEFPSIKRRGGNFELLEDKHGFVVAGMDNLKYRSYEIQLNEGDMVFVYTDGVPEANNIDEELYGTDRMLMALNSKPSDDCVEIIQMVGEDIVQFVGAAEQFDDITMLSFKFLKKMNQG